MGDHSKTSLKEYKNACERLKGEIDLAIRDLEFKKSGKLLYAVDFSEIFAYVLPSESFKGFIIFPDAFDDDNEVAEAVALQQLVLRHIFFELSPKPKPVLLSPYILEFRTFVRSLPDKLFLDSIQRTVQVFNDLENILADGVDKEVEAICQNIEGESEYAPSQEEERIIAEFVRKYGYIDSFLEAGVSEGHPFNRIKQLRPNTAFAELSDLFPEPLPAGTEVYERWVILLYELRRHQGRISSTELDASAINLIYHSNQKLPANTRLILITRSETMHQLYRQEVDDGLWGDAGEYPLLRHPRVFSVALSVAQRSSDDVQDLRDLSETISLFMDGYRTQKPGEPISDETLMEQIIKIKQDWKRIQKTASPLTSASPQGEIETKLRKVKQARRIINYAKNDQDVRKRIVQILNGFFSDIDFAHDVLKLELQIPQDLQDMEDDRSTIHCSYSLSPYKVVLQTAAGMRILDELSGKTQIKTEDVISAFKLAFELSEAEERPNEDYDRNLAMAFILGSLINQWEIAEKYCSRAIRVSERAAISAHEAFYYQAICKRQIQVSNLDEKITNESLEEILSLLDRAIATANDHKLDDRIAARYWVEKGIAILSFHETPLNPGEKLPTVTEALNLLAHWDSKLEDELPLRLFKLRSELDYVVGDQRFIRELPRLKDKFVRLEKEMLHFEVKRSEWPPYIVDLMLWGRSVFFPDELSDNEKRRKIVKQLREAKDNEINKEIRQDISRHIKDVEKR